MTWTINFNTESKKNQWGTNGDPLISKNHINMWPTPHAFNVRLSSICKAILTGNQPMVQK